MSDRGFNDVTLIMFAGPIPASFAGHPSLQAIELKGDQLTAFPDAWTAPLPQNVTPNGLPLNYVRTSYNEIAVSCTRIFKVLRT